MSTSSSSAAAAAASGAAAMADAPAGEAAPKLKIGSHLSRNYKEDKNPSGFLCGHCSSVNQLSFGDTTVRCRDCGNRILYKVRQRRPLEYLAR